VNVHNREPRTVNQLHILLGSTRPAKVEGARDAIAAIAAIDPAFSQATFHMHDLGGVGPRMPMTRAAIVDGARTRAAALLARLRDAGAGYAIGLEGGLDSLVVDGREEHLLETWAAVTDGTRWSIGAGGTVLVPPHVIARVRAGAELGDVIDGMAAAHVRGTRGAWGVLTRDLVSRRDAFRLAVLSAFAPFYNAAAYAGR
jgi:non-canonical (house-cleaning) NTP pyrophosphatase